LQSSSQSAEYPDSLEITVKADGTEVIAGTSITPLYASSSVNVKVYAVNYNVLRIMNGLGGVAFTN